MHDIVRLANEPRVISAWLQLRSGAAYTLMGSLYLTLGEAVAHHDPFGSPALRAWTFELASKEDP